MKRNQLIVVAILIGLLGSLSFGGNTGKISGIITDAQNGTPLAGANVIIEGSTMGSAADVSGNYVILNVTPGKYNLKVSMIGYKPITITDVEVNMNLTTTINVPLQTEALGMEEVVVVAKRPIVAKDVANSELTVDSKNIETMPVTELSEVVGLQAGVEGFEVRGGEARQTLLIVDGFIMSDERSNKPLTSMNLSSVQEIQLQSGGMGAEYSNARSGVLNVVTAEGGRSQYSGVLKITYSPAHAKHYGISAYDPYSYYNRIYNDPDVCYTGTTNGTWDTWTQSEYSKFEGWNSIAQDLLSDDDETNDLTPEALRRVYYWRHRRQGDIKKPDYSVDINIGGPVPYISSKLGSLRFYATYSNLRDMLIVPLSRDAYYDQVGKIKLTADLDKKTTLTMVGQYNVQKSSSQYSWTTTPTGDILRSDYTVASLVKASAATLYMPGYYSPADIYNSMVGLKVNRVINTKSYFDAVLQYDRHRYNTYEMELRDTSKIYEILNGYFVDEAPYGYWGYSTASLEGMSTGGWMNLGRDSSIISTVRFNFDYLNQIHPSHQIKAGLSMVFNNLDIRSTTVNPSMSTWNRSQIYQEYPYRMNFYAQDKMEFEGFIANMGANLDVSNANSDVYILSDYDVYYTAGYGNNIEEAVDTRKTKVRVKLSPRLAISHPITDNSKLYFNYGHYYSEAASTYRFRLQREANGKVTYLGNPDLGYEKTVSYEVGYSQNLFNQVLLNLAAYYKDVTNQIGWIYYQSVNSAVAYYRAESNNYEDIRGFEITLDKKTGNWFSGFVNYTYMVSSTGYFGVQKYYQDASLQRTYLLDNPTQDKPHPQPYSRANLDFHTPADFGPKMYSIHPLGGWNLAFLGSWRAGAYDTYNPNSIAGLINNVQWVDSWDLDAKLTKTFEIKKMQFQAYVEVTNLLNLKYLSYTGFTDSYDYNDYLASLHFSWEEGIEKGSDRIGVYREDDIDYIPMQSTSNHLNLASPDERVLYYDMSTDGYFQYEDNQWVSRSKDWVKKNVLDTKAYIDMPNNTSFTFLYPREIKFGLKVSF